MGRQHVLPLRHGAHARHGDPGSSGLGGFWRRHTGLGERVAADYLVLATGSSYAYPARLAADSIEEALVDLHQTNKELASAQRVLILGAGPVGLELAGEIRTSGRTSR
ncbi:FAD-dependent oxidoreductase [Micromonospora sp. M12]